MVSAAGVGVREPAHRARYGGTTFRLVRVLASGSFRGQAVLCGAALAAASGIFAPAAPAATEDFKARGSVEQVYATGLEPNERAVLLRRGEKRDASRANEQGGLLFRRVKPGRGYRVDPAAGEPSPKLRVMTDRSAPPNESIYDQEMTPDGYGYIKMRDGIKLSYSVRPPTDLKDVLPDLPIPIDLPEIGVPNPTLIEYAGYGYADPNGPESGIAVIGNLMGFTVVNVNMRGTGCSGGAFDFFEPLQSLDGYDVIETVARQAWVKGKPGMMGISYGGISQLFVGATNPPSLSAITPVSLIDNTQTTLFPGGILNTGFALEWAKDRIHDALPAGPDSGQPWAWDRIQNGDQTCAKNQAMHGEARDLLRKINANRFYRPKVADPLAPVTFAHKIKAPTFLACQWTDEQTGGHCPTLADSMSGNDKAWFTFTNGTHVDSLSPEVFNRFYDFLKLYVAEEHPAAGAPLVNAGAPVLYQEAFGIEGVTLRPDPIQAQPTYEAALEAFEDQPPVRILFDNGAGALPGEEPGEPYPGYETFFERWPVPETKGKTWFLGKNEKLRREPARGSRTDGFTLDADARPPTNFTGDTGAGDLWTRFPSYEWSQPVEGNAASYVTKPLKRDTTVLGSGFVRLWLRSSKPKVDFQATVTEVRPDGKEVFVQGGWLRGSLRKLDRERSERLRPFLSLRKRHEKPLPSDRFTRATIPLYYQGHAYRAGSQIRVYISAVGGDQPIWAFARSKPKGTAEVEIAHGKRHRSKLTLPKIRDAEIPTELPPCPGLRGEPCRDYVEFENR